MVKLSLETQIVVILLIMSMICYANPALQPAFALLKHERFMATPQEANVRCDALCSRELDCRGYTYIARSRTHSPLTSGGATDFSTSASVTDAITTDPNKQILYDCYLETNSFKYIRSQIHPTVFDTTGATRMADIEVGVSHLLRGPMVTSADTFLHIPTHFVRGCSYTISMWVWIWEPEVLNDHEIPLLTSRMLEFSAQSSHSQSSQFAGKDKVTSETRGTNRPGLGTAEKDEILAPSIVYNVGSETQKRNFFFAASRDLHGNIHGFWGNPFGKEEFTVKYNRWTHLAMSIEEDAAVGTSGAGILRGYINGHAVGSVEMEAPKQSKGQGVRGTHGRMQCPYNVATQSNAGVLLQVPGAPVTSVTPTRHKALNNTVIQVMGTGAGGVIGTAGMVQDLVVVANKALAPEQIRALAQLNPPVVLPTLDRLLRLYNINGYIGQVCVLDLGGGQDEFAREKAPERTESPHRGAEHVHYSFYFYRAIEWGMCPPTVCGLQNLDPAFLRSLELYQPSTVAVPTPTEWELTAVDGSRIEPRPDSLLRRSANYKPTKSIAHNTLVNDSNILADSVHLGFSTYQHVAATVTGLRGRLTQLFAEMLAFSERTIGESQHQLPQDQAQTSSQEEQQFLLDKDSVPALEDLEANPRLVQEQMVSDLYDSAMLWLHGNALVRQEKLSNSPLYELHELDPLQEDSAWEEVVQPMFNTATAGSTEHRVPQASPSVFLEEDFSLRNRQYIHEKVFSSLALATWLAHDNQALHPATLTSGWNFRAAPPMSQPLHMALAHKLYWDPAEHTTVLLPVDLGAYLRQSLALGVEIMDLVLGVSSTQSPTGATAASAATRDAQNIDSTDKGSAWASPPSPGGWSGLIPQVPASVPYAEVPADQNASLASVAVVAERRKAPEPPQHKGATSAEEAMEQIQAKRAYEAALRDWQENEQIWLQEEQLQQLRQMQELDTSLPEQPKQHLVQSNWLEQFVKLEGRAYVAEMDNSPLERQEQAPTRLTLVPELAPLQAAGLVPELLQHVQLATLREAYVAAGAQVETQYSGAFALRERALHILREALPSTASSTMDSSSTSPTRPKYSLPAQKHHGQCRLAAAHLFPVATYVTSHYGLVGTGVGAIDDVRIASADLNEQAGTETDTHAYYLAEAQDGNDNAMLYLARRYFWGQGGVRADPEQARYWFERAAAVNNAEGLYNVGVLHSSGQIGYTANQTKALEYFNMSAHPVRGDQAPFPMALHALGAHYQNKGREHWKTAKDYYTRAAEAGSTDGHHALATMLQAGQGGSVDIPGAVRHSVIACNAGHTRSKYFLAQALYDPESWLYTYGREQAWREQENQRRVLLGQPEISEPSAATEASFDGWRYDPKVSSQFILTFGHIQVEIPTPLGQTDGCVAALALLQSLSHMSGRTNDLVDAGLSAFLEGNLYESLELYNEAAELGVASAQENSALILHEIAQLECAVPGNRIGGRILKWLTQWLGISTADAQGQEKLYKWIPLRDLGIDAHLDAEGGNDDELDADDHEQLMLDIEVDALEWESILQEQTCLEYFDRMIRTRYVQLANWGDAAAKAALAQTYLKAPERSASDAVYATALLIYAAEQGDIASLMDLGWVFYEDNMPFENRTVSRNIFRAVKQWEDALKPGSSTGYSADSTGGMASYLALLYCDVDLWAERVGLISIAATLRAFRYLGEGMLNDALALFGINTIYYDNIYNLQAELEHLTYEMSTKITGDSIDQERHNRKLWNESAQQMYPPSFKWVLKQMLQMFYDENELFHAENNRGDLSEGENAIMSSVNSKNMPLLQSVTYLVLTCVAFVVFALIRFILRRRANNA